MRIAVYTSLAVNYLPKARALSESLKRHHPDAALVACINDVPPAGLDLGAEPFDDVWLPGDLGYDPAWIFEHNVMELCTAVKGRALRRLMDRFEADFYLYLDPDVFVYAPLDPVAEYMAGAEIGVVPHILAPEDTEVGVELTEMSVTEHGIYNLGHLVVRRGETGLALAEWWADRLDRHCFDDKARGLFTDQRWFDLVPAIFDGVRVLRVPNLDVASWNVATRHVSYADDGPSPYDVDGYPLLTYHFSGTGPTGTHRRIREVFVPHNEAVAEIERDYEAAIARHGQAELEANPFAYDRFRDGAPVTARMRRLYRDSPDLKTAFPDPFAPALPGPSFQSWLRNHRPDLAGSIVLPRAAVRVAFDELFDEDYYLARYPDVAERVRAGEFGSALDHYVAEGSRRLYDPNEFFCARLYKERAGDLDGWLTSGVKPERSRTLLWHYLTVGLANGVEPIELFDSAWYLSHYSDLRAAFDTGKLLSPLGHYRRSGAAEGRSPGPDFRASAYLERVERVLGQEAADEARRLGAFRHYMRSREPSAPREPSGPDAQAG